MSSQGKSQNRPTARSPAGRFSVMTGDGSSPAFSLTKAGVSSIRDEVVRRDTESENNFRIASQEIALERCIQNCLRAKEIRNTVFRYGKEQTYLMDTNPRLYRRWIDAKKKSLGSGALWTELVSTHMTSKDPQQAFERDAEGCFKRYSAYKTDDRADIAQITIFTFEDDTEEVIFDWETPDIEKGPIYFNTEAPLIDRLKTYFDKQVERSRRDNPISVEIDPYFLHRHSDPSEPFYVWFYEVKIRNQGYENYKLVGREWHVREGEYWSKPIFGKMRRRRSINNWAG